MRSVRHEGLKGQARKGGPGREEEYYKDLEEINKHVKDVNDANTGLNISYFIAVPNRKQILVT